MKTILQSLSKLGHRFWFLWLGESITSLGGQLVQFAFGVWIYQRTGSVLSFSGSIAAGIVPALLVMPFAGALVDRGNRRTIIIVCDCLGALMSIVFVGVVLTDRLEIYHLYIFAAISSTVSAFHEPAYQASVNTILSQENLARASGAMSIGHTTLGIVAPTLAGVLMAAMGLPGLVSLDLVALLFGTLLVWTAFGKRPPVALAAIEEPVRPPRPSPLRNMLQSMSFFTDDRKMLTLLVYSLIQSAMLALASTMVIPLILSLHSSPQLGIALTFGALGGLVGSVVMVVLDSPRRRMAVILLCDVVLTSCIILAGLSSSIVAFCILEFIACAAASIGASCAYALWMSKVPVARQGSVLVILSNAAMLATAVSVVSGGILISLLDPALAAGGSLASLAREWIGSGKASGLALMFVLSGSLGLLASLGGLAYRPLREL